MKKYGKIASMILLKFKSEFLIGAKNAALALRS